ncbi:MAG TPA: glycosyltransferase [Steroidobacteraceae bacterium]|nr:glycosyltransferase [Steroidobacteraceae bacterium]
MAIPLQGSRFLRRVNRLIVSQSLYFWLRVLKFNRQILWTYNPMTMEFLRLTDFGKTVYHCVDDIKAQPDMPAKDIQAAEEQLVASCNVCFVTSLQLLENCRRINPDTHYFPNVADYRHFSKALSDETPLQAALEQMPKPMIGFIGAISSYKVDFELIRSLGLAHPDWSIVMIGQVGEGDPHTDVSTLTGLPNIHLLGPRPYADLPSYLKAFDVAILPSNLNDYTRSMFPMKFFEYLAAGKPVVATDLHALHPFRDFAYLASDHGDFARGVEAALRGEGPDLERRLELAQQQTYEQRTERMLQLIPGELLG